MGDNVVVRVVSLFLLLVLLGACSSTQQRPEQARRPSTESWRNSPCYQASDTFRADCIAARESMGLPPQLVPPDASSVEKNCAEEAVRQGAVGADFPTQVAACKREHRTPEEIAKDSAAEDARRAKENEEMKMELAEAARRNQAIRAALDAHLAASLKDPASAIQYAVGTPTKCRNVMTGPVQTLDSWCVCYFVNAKNSMGGYTGAQLGVVSLIDSKQPYLMLDIPKELIVNPSGCGDVLPRNAALIHALVK